MNALKIRLHIFLFVLIFLSGNNFSSAESVDVCKQFIVYPVAEQRVNDVEYRQAKIIEWAQGASVNFIFVRVFMEKAWIIKVKSAPLPDSDVIVTFIGKDAEVSSIECDAVMRIYR